MLIRCVLLISCLVFPACNLQSNPVIPEPTAVAVTPEAPTDTWETIADGLAMRTYIPDDAEMLQLTVIRIDPAHYRFRALYRAGDPLTIAGWQNAEPQARVIINANFFSIDNTVLGLLVSDGQVFGESYRDRGGTFLVQDGIPSIRGNVSQPYQGEPLEQAVQAFPMLVENGQATFFNSGGDERTRRTVIAQDADGNILVMATPFLGQTLADLSAYLPTTDMNIVNAFNLDGGGSTMMAVPEADFLLPSFDAVPAVLAVYPR